MTLGIIIGYLVLVLAVGLLSNRLFRGTGEDYFLATRSIGPFVLLMSLFGTHMTAFSLLGASGEAYRRGVGVFALMASSSAIVVPVVFFFVGIPLWELGKRHGYVTQVEYFRDRWDSPALGLGLFVVLVTLVVPYLLIGVLGGGLTLEQITEGQVPRWLGSLIVSLVVLGYVTSGGLRGTAWANTLQTLVFMVLGALTFFWVVGQAGGLASTMQRVAESQPQLLVRGDRMRLVEMATYAFIPLSVGMFPHIFMHWLTARSASSFRLPVIAYPLCVMVVWLPSVLLGVVGTVEVPGLQGPAANSVLVRLIDLHAPEMLAGLLAAGVFAAIMSSLDSQVLSLGTMFTRDVVGRLRGSASAGPSQVATGRAFVVAILALTYLISLVSTPRIFQLAVWSFTGFAGLFPLAVAALYWRRSTRQGAIAAIATVVVLWTGFFIDGFGVPGYTVAGSGVMPVAAITAASTLVLIVVSLLTNAPERRVLEKFFPVKIAYIAAGAAGMYCGSCLHDNTLAAAMQKAGHDVALIPTYTPIRTDEDDVSIDRVFYGAINVYLEQKSALFRHTPWLVDRMLDTPSLLNWVTRSGVSTDARELGALTLSVLLGEEGKQAKELSKLIEWLRDDYRPDVVHLTNSMFAGMARRIKAELGVPVVCSVQGEDIFLDDLEEPHKSRVMAALADRSGDVDAFVAPSSYYADYMSRYLGGVDDRMKVIPLGLKLDGHGSPAPAAHRPFIVGYLARICPEKGLHLLVDAFRRLVERAGPDQARLRIAGWMGEKDRPYLEGIEEQIRVWGLEDVVDVLGELDRSRKIEFIQVAHVLSVPTVYKEPKGLFVLEALANGIPVVQPRHGSFPELIDATGGGLLFEPGSAEGLADALAELMDDPQRREELGARGREVVHRGYGEASMAERNLALYRDLIAATS